jgi:hypothetical protein
MCSIVPPRWTTRVDGRDARDLVSDCVIGPQNPKLVRLMASSAQIRSLDAGGTRNDTWRNIETEGNRRLQPIRDKERGRRNEHQWRVLIKLQHSKDTG